MTKLSSLRGRFGLWQAQLPAVAAQDSLEGDDSGKKEIMKKRIYGEEEFLKR